MNGTDTPSVAYCRACGKALTEEMQKLSHGAVYCEEHVPQAAFTATEPNAPPPSGASLNDSSSSPWSAPPTPSAASAKYTAPSASPGLAFLLGLIPGVGAIYNGQYAKGLLHVVIMGMMASIASSDESGGLSWMFGMLLFVFPFYMAFEAYHTALRREKGLPVDEFSSILPLRGNAKGTFPAGPVVLIAVGFVFLLHNLELIRFSHLVRFWPVLLIALGVYMIYVRVSSRDSTNGEAGHEQ
jgi:TM2 domain-containing membrane protein YozV